MERFLGCVNIYKVIDPLLVSGREEVVHWHSKGVRVANDPRCGPLGNESTTCGPVGSVVQVHIIHILQVHSLLGIPSLHTPDDTSMFLVRPLVARVCV